MTNLDAAGELAAKIVGHHVAYFHDLTDRQKRKQTWWAERRIEDLTSVLVNFLPDESFIHLYVPPDLALFYGDAVGDDRLEKNEKIQMLLGSVRPRRFYRTQINEMSTFAREERLQHWLFFDGATINDSTADHCISWFEGRLELAMRKYGYTTDGLDKGED